MNKINYFPYLIITLLLIVLLDHYVFTDPQYRKENGTGIYSFDVLDSIEVKYDHVYVYFSHYDIPEISIKNTGYIEMWRFGKGIKRRIFIGKDPGGNLIKDATQEFQLVSEYEWVTIP